MSLSLSLSPLSFTQALWLTIHSLSLSLSLVCVRVVPKVRYWEIADLPSEQAFLEVMQDMVEGAKLGQQVHRPDEEEKLTRAREEGSGGREERKRAAAEASRAGQQQTNNGDGDGDGNQHDDDGHHVPSFKTRLVDKQKVKEDISRLSMFRK